MNNNIIIENTRFIYATNFDGNPDADQMYHSAERKGNVIIPNPKMAEDMIAAGFNVKQTKSKDDDPDFVPEYYILVRMNFKSKFPPKVHLVSGNNKPVRLNENNVVTIDDLQNDRGIENVNLIANVYENPNSGTKTLYVKTMYVEQGFGNDPFAERYAGVGGCGHECSGCCHHDAETNSCEGESLPFNEED